MNNSLVTADGVTHLKIVSLALAAAIAVVWIGISARAAAPTAFRSQVEKSMPLPLTVSLPEQVG